MKHALVILVFFVVQGIRCQNCTDRTNRQPKICSKLCDPAQDGCKGNRDCVCDGDCGYSCVKKDLQCPRLTIDNGRVRYNNRTLGSVARYRCTPPYKAVGSKKRTCRGNGQWDGEKPTCKLICVDPGNIQHGTKSHDGFESGKEVKYRCLPGFTMEGSNTLTCTRTGVWDKVKPSCTCKRTNKEAFRYCRKSCNPASNSCSKDKECACDGDCGYSCLPKAIDCGKPTALDNGRRQYSSTTFGSTVSYQCNKPYSLLGSKKRTCRGIRKWDGTEPSCKIICQDPGGIANGNKQIFRRNPDEDYVSVGDRAEYNCFPGYNMEGSKYLTCTDSGGWNRAKPKCIVPSCGPPELPSNSELRVSKSKKSSYKYSEKVFIKCKSGYFSRGLGMLNCGLQGWTDPSFTCLPKTCGNPGSPANGKRNSYIFTFGSRVDFDCNRGYKLVGDKYMICQANQRWSGRLPTCEQIDCGVLPIPDKAEKILETHTKFGGVVRFKCKEKGYEISGSEIRTCGNNGLWSGSPTSCDIITCGDPGTPLNGQQADVKNGYNYGGSVRFTCKDNYTLSGTSEIFCEETKDWSSPIPKCWAPCLDPGVPGNGSRSGHDFRHAKSVTFSCNEDYEVEGDATITCNNGHWTSTTPLCKVISCKDPGSPLHGRQSKVSKNFIVGGFVRFKCNENYTMMGSRKLTCLKNKTWDGERPKCYASCPYPGHPENGQTIGRVFDHDSDVEFECLGNRLLQGSSQAKCSNGKWDQVLPTCRDCGGTGLPLGMESRKIPDTSIKSSSNKTQHPAYHGRLGGDSYWCSEEKKGDFIHIHLPKKYKITGARIELKSEYVIKSIVLKGKILQDWVDFYYELRPAYNKEVEQQIKAENPFIAQSVRIKVLKMKRESICLRAEVYGCGIPRGCIMRGSAVLIKHKGKYQRGFVGGYISTKANLLEVFLPGEENSIPVARAAVILDEKPDVHELVKGKLVLGKDITIPRLIRKGKLEQRTDSFCTIKTNDETWKSDLKDIRIDKISAFCS